METLIGMGVIAVALIGNWFTMGQKIAKLEGKMCIMIRLLEGK